MTKLFAEITLKSGSLQTSSEHEIFHAFCVHKSSKITEMKSEFVYNYRQNDRNSEKMLNCE